jgi:hypothetical protein
MIEKLVVENKRLIRRYPGKKGVQKTNRRKRREMKTAR